MKKITFLFAFVSVIGFSQTSIKYDYNHILPSYVVNEVDGMSANDMYQKSINWIKEMFKNPDKVIKAQIEGEMVRFNGTCVDCILVQVMGSKSYFTASYTVSLYFKDGRYKFEIKDYIYNTGSPYFVKTSLEDVSPFYKKNGDVRKTHKDVPVSGEQIINDLNTSLYNYLTNTGGSKNDDW